MATPRRISSRLKTEGRFLRLEEAVFSDHEGNERTWEVASRRNNQAAVLMVPILRPSGRYVLIEQYRPPMDAYVLEFPAGLVDPGEEPARTAQRELREETGYRGRVVWLGEPACSSPGMTDEQVILAFVDIDETQPDNRNPEPQPEEGEHIRIHLLNPEEAGTFLRARQDQNVLLDSRTVAFFMGAGHRW